MIVPITSMVAGALGLLVVILAFITVARRAKLDTLWGDGDEQPLRAAIRAHANLIEYAPIFLILLTLLELSKANSTLLMALGATFVTARVIYVAYFHIKQALPLRILGFLGTSIPIAVAAVALFIV